MSDSVINSAAPSPGLRITLLGAGAAGMYCGSCLRENSLAMALRRLGHDVTLVPLYTPIRTDEPEAGLHEVFYGGVNVYLQYASAVFRHTPRFLDWLFDRPWLLMAAGTRGAQTSPAKIGPLILSILQGEDGPQIKELRRLLKFLKDQLRPQIVSLPNAMFMGLAGVLRRELKAKIVCELTGEDIFLDAMADPWRSEAQKLIRRHCNEVDRFVATSRYYAERMAGYLGVDRSRISVVHPGISREHLSTAPPAADNAAPTVGYFARICPEKGIDRLLDVLPTLRRRPGMSQAVVRAAGYLGPAHHQWHDRLIERLAHDGPADAYRYEGEKDFAGKLAFLDSVDVLCVPTVYAEAKGIYILEALARGLPVVQPAHGAFPELIEMTGGGVLAPAGDADALCDALAGLLLDHPRRAALGAAGRRAIEAAFTDDHMAAKMLRIYREILS